MSNKIKEVWEEIPNTNGMYEASTYGRIRSYFAGSRGISDTPKIIANTRSKNGYPFVTIYINGNQSPQYVHRIIGEMFVDNPNKKPQINHIDGDRKNNHYTNLEWSTQAENVRHAVENGMWKRGESRKDAKVKRKDVVKIRSMYISGKYTQSKLADMFGLHQTAISKIILKQTWSHV